MFKINLNTVVQQIYAGIALHGLLRHSELVGPSSPTKYEDLVEMAYQIARQLSESVDCHPEPKK